VDARTIGNALVDEKPMQVLGPAAVVTDPPPGRDEGRQHIGAQGYLHLQQCIEASRQRAT
jgi:hypothetical protein